MVVLGTDGGGGAVIVYVARDRFDRVAVERSLARWSAAFALLLPVAVFVIVRLDYTYVGITAHFALNLALACLLAALPFLALGALLAAGLDGIANKRDPGEPTLVDPDTLSETERARRGIRRLPKSLSEALDELERDHVLGEALGETLAKPIAPVSVLALLSS